jgi:hypothetical protein
MTATTTVSSVGGLLPSDLLARVAVGDSSLPGIAPNDYGLVPGERLNDHITRSWNRLQGLWANFTDQLAALPETDRTATSLTRERWLLPLLDELGFAGLPVAKTQVVDGKEYPISHEWDGQIAVHLPGARIAVDRRTHGVPGAATTSPHGLVQEYLNRSNDHLWAIVSNGLVLRILRDNASLTRQAYVEFDLEAMFDGEAFADFVVLWLTCHRTRFTADQADKCLLEQWAQEAASSGTRALDKLREGVEDAIVGLGSGFVAHPANGALRDALRDGSLSTTDYQRQLLRTVYRLLFLLVAEQRDLLLDTDADPTAKERYRRYYGIERLRTLATLRRGTTHDDLWDSLELVIRSLHRDGAPALGIAPLGSFLWSPDATGGLNDCRLQNRHLLEVIRSLTLVRDAESRVHRSVDYRNLGSEELGSIYESLLELHADVDPDARTFRLDTAAGNERKTTGSYYTPTSLITELLDSALDPVLDEAARDPDPEAAILGLSVLDPAIGSGHFVIAAANRIAQRLASIRAGGIEPAPDEVRNALRDVIGSCVYGIDVNPMAVELCKISLWLESMEPGKPLSFLDHRIVCGNGLLGATPRLLAEGVPDDAYKPLLGDDKKSVTSLKKRNKAERQGQMQLGFSAGSIAELARPAAAAVAAIDAIDDDSLAGITEKQRLLAELAASEDAAKAKLATDAWCAAFVCPKGPGEPEITTDTVRRIADDPSRVDPAVIDRVRQLADEYAFLHPHLAFPDLFTVPDDVGQATNERTGWSGGVSLCAGNPPWERVKLQEKEFFAQRDSDIAAASSAAVRKRMIKATTEENPALWNEFQQASRNAEGQSHLLRSSGRFPLCGRGDVNTYTVFAEAMRDLISPTGRMGVIVPSGIATDDTTKFFFQDIVERRNLVSLFDLENRKRIFQGIDSRIKFCLLTLTGDARPIEEAEFVFFALDTGDLSDAERRFTLTPEDFELLNPNTRTCPIFRSRRDAEITKGIYRRVPVLRTQTAESPWNLRITRLFDLGKDELTRSLVSPGSEGGVVVYQAKMFDAFDHRLASVERRELNASRQLQPVLLPEARKSDPQALVGSALWLPRDTYELVRPPEHKRWMVGFADVSSSTNHRTMIAAVLPPSATDYTVRVFLGRPLEPKEAAFLVACLNSFVYDYQLRLKLGGLHVSDYITYQTPVPTPGSWTMSRHVLELTYTAWDLAGFAQDIGHDGAPFVYTPERRRLLRAELDAHFLHAYGLSRSDSAYLLDSFPIVRRKDETEHGEYRTKRLILECYDRMAAAKASGKPYETILDPPPADPSLCHPESTRPDWADLYLEL